jgi:O-glycosyl hydrolase
MAFAVIPIHDMLRAPKKRGGNGARAARNQFMTTLGPLIAALGLLVSGCGIRSSALSESSRDSAAERAGESQSQQPAGVRIHWWLSSEDGASRLSPQPDLQFRRSPPPGRGTIQIDETTAYQTVLGLGSSLEHSTCYNLSLLPPAQRDKVIESLVHPERGIGMNLMRLCIGTSDFAPGPFYTYDDMPPGEEDPGLERFSIDQDREYVLPVIKLAQRSNPNLKFIASPWTPPPWMKTNGRYGGGRLRRECYPVFAEYLVRFIEAYRQEDIPIHALTIQNEPEFGPEAYPTCLWTALEQRDFIRHHLGPLFRARGIDTAIWIFDHNFNNPGFPATILRDPQAAPFVGGSAFHLYEGRPEAMSKLHRQFPDKTIHFTEGSVYGSKGAAEIISYFRNWAGSYNAWVTMIDDQGKPNVSGFHDCDPTIIVLNRDTLETRYRADYYLYGQFMRFIQPGAVRIATHLPRGAPPNVAFRNPDGGVVLVAANPQANPRPLSFSWRGTVAEAVLPSRSAATFRWMP